MDLNLKRDVRLWAIRGAIGITITALLYWLHPMAAAIYGVLWALTSDAGYVFLAWAKRTGVA
jgi:hypothetical protein